MGVVNFASTIFSFIYIGLIVLLIVSFTLLSEEFLSILPRKISI